jgi:hypothetical protein
LLPRVPLPDEIEEAEHEVEPPPELPPREGINLRTVLKVIQLLISPDPDDPLKAYTRGTGAIFAYLCDVLGIDTGDIDRERRTAKKALYEKILYEVSGWLIK